MGNQIFKRVFWWHYQVILSHSSLSSCAIKVNIVECITCQVHFVEGCNCMSCWTRLVSDQSFSGWNLKMLFVIGAEVLILTHGTTLICASNYIAIWGFISVMHMTEPLFVLVIENRAMNSGLGTLNVRSLVFVGRVACATSPVFILNFYRSNQPWLMLASIWQFVCRVQRVYLSNIQMFFLVIH